MACSIHGALLALNMIIILENVRVDSYCAICLRYSILRLGRGRFKLILLVLGVSDGVGTVGVVGVQYFMIMTYDILR